MSFLKADETNLEFKKKCEIFLKLKTNVNGNADDFFKYQDFIFEIEVLFNISCELFIRIYSIIFCVQCHVAPRHSFCIKREAVVIFCQSYCSTT